MTIAENNKLLRIAAIPVIALCLQGCLNTVARPVSESARDTSGTFDGNWLAVGKSTAAVQQGIGNWRMNCTNMAGRKFGPIKIQGGVVSMAVGDNIGETFVNSSGKFRIEIPIESKATSPSGALSSGDTTFVLSGSLPDKSGFLTFAVEGLGNTGCTSKMTYNKL